MKSLVLPLQRLAKFLVFVMFFSLMSGTSTLFVSPAAALMRVCVEGTDYVVLSSTSPVVLKFIGGTPCDFAVPNSVESMTVLAVGGGGGGGADGGSGGGGGELRYHDSFTVTAKESLTISVGSGGRGGIWNMRSAETGTSTTVSRGETIVFQANPGSRGDGWAGSGEGRPGGLGGSGGLGGIGTNGQSGGKGPTAICQTTVSKGQSPSGTTPSNSISGSSVDYGGGGGGGIGVNYDSTALEENGPSGGGTSGGQGANYKKQLNGNPAPNGKGSSRGQGGTTNTGGGGGAGSACNSYGNQGSTLSNAETWDSIVYTAGSVVDSSTQRTHGGNGADGVVILKYNVDLTAPIVNSRTPADGAAHVDSSTDVVLTFSENVTRGTGDAFLKKLSDNSTVETFTVSNSAHVSIFGSTVTFNVTSSLQVGSGYYLTIPATAFTDSSGNTFVGITDNSYEFTIGPDPIPSDKALTFDGTNDFAYVADQNSLDLNNFTFEAWVNPSTTSLEMQLINKEDSYEVAIRSGTIQYALNNGSGWSWITTGITITSNVWTHIAFVKSGTTVSIYKNGNSSAAYTNSSQPATLANTAKRLTIGARCGGDCTDASTTSFFQGSMNDVRLWSTARSGAEIAANYNKRVASNLGTWFFDEGSGTTAYNGARVGGRALNLTLVNSPTWTSTGLNSSNTTLASANYASVSGYVHGYGLSASADISFDSITVSNGTLTLEASTGAFTFDPTDAASGDFYFDYTTTLNGVSTSRSRINFTISESDPPDLTGVAFTSTPRAGQNDQYRLGDSITVTATFNESVLVDLGGESPTVTISLGSDTRTATYRSGSGTTSLVFIYNIVASDSETSGIRMSANSLSIPAGTTIKDSAGNDAVITHDLVTSTQKVDGAIPTITSVTLSADRVYKEGETITVTVNFSETVTVTGTVKVPIVGLTSEFAEFASDSSTATSKVFIYTVDSDDVDSDGVAITANSIDVTSGTVRDSAGNDANLNFTGLAPPGTPRIDGVAPTVVSFSTSKSAGSYKLGETFSITATISETVTSAASITATLSSGGTVVLNYATATTLTGTYTVLAGESTTALTVSSFALTSAPVDSAGNAMSSTTVPGGSNNLDSGGTKSIKVDTTAPTATGSTTPSVAENSTVVGTYSANENVTWSIISVAAGGGADAAKFSLGSGTDTSTVLSFVSAPNFESPTATSGNNTYLVSLKLVDVAGNIETVTVTVSVTNVIDSATISSISFTSNPAAAGGYIVGEVVELSVVFSEVVTVLAGTGYPRIELQGLASKFAVYSSGSGTNTLKFTYTIASGDTDGDGLSLLANSIEVDTSTIRNSDNQDSDLSHSLVAASTSQKVNAVAPLLASSSPTDNAVNVGLNDNIVLTFTKTVLKGSTGNITIKSGATNFEVIPIADAKITISGGVVTINPAGTFANSTNYYVLVDSTAFKDESGNFFTGISAETTLNFKTRSTLSITTPSGSGLTGYVGYWAGLSLTTSGGDGSNAFSVTTGTLPAGLTISSSTGQITGRPTTAGTSAIVVSVTDASGTTVSTSSFNLVINTPSFRQFDNGKIRIGNATGENSVNSKGNFQQPFYKSGSNYFKLTYSTYSLNFAFGSGTTNTSYFNGNLSPLVQDPTMSSQSIDYSGFIGTTATGTGIRGYGTIVSTGRFTLNTQTFELKNTFVLTETGSSIRITSQITNLSASTATNLTFWAGTQDDWVGSTDRPTKTKGNLSGGVFTAITNASTLAKALKITSGSEGVLFFSTHPNANTSHDGCCSFSNTTRKNPTSSLITNTNDGSYALYVPFGNVASNESANFTWYYAAGPSAELSTVESSLSTLANDTTAPTISSVSISSNAGSDNTYKVDDPISVSVAFSEVVSVTGTPQFTLNVGGTNRTMNYFSGTGTNTLVFRYSIASGETDNDGVSASANALSLNSGSIADASGNNATLTHSAISASTSHLVDGIVPTLSSSSPTDGATGFSVTGNIELTFSENVSAGTGTIDLYKVSTNSIIEQIPIGGARVTISGTRVTINPDATLESLVDYAVRISSTAITDVAGNAYAGISDNTTLNFRSADATAATVTSVSSDTADGTYARTQSGSQVTIPIRVRFSKNVTVVTAGGKPELVLETGATDARAGYVSGSGTSTLVFNYVVADGDVSSDLDYVSVSALELGTATIRDAAGNDANVTLPTPGSANSLSGLKAIAIDTVAPTLSSSSPADNATAILANTNLVLTFSETLTASTGTITLYRSDATTIQSFSINAGALPSGVTISGSTLTIDPSSDLASNTGYYLNISSGAFVDAAGNAFAGITTNTALNFTSEDFTPVTPTISTQPTNTSTTAGRSFTLSLNVTAPALGTLTYQWFKGGIAISGATSDSYTVTSSSSTDQGDYTVVVTNTYRGATSTTTSTTASVTINEGIAITYSSTTVTSTYGTPTTSVAPSSTGGTGSITWSIAKSSDNSTVTGISINSSTGVISVTGAVPSASYGMTVTGTDVSGATASATITVSVSRKTLTISGMTANNKGYDGSTTATLNFGSATLQGVETVDVGSVSYVTTVAQGNFASAVVATGVTVTATGITLFGPASDNYSLTNPTTTANITLGTQTITITSTAPTKTIPGRTYTPTATSNSGLTVAITLDPATTSICSLAAGVVTFDTSGTCRIRFNQAGDSSWESATQVTQAILVGKLSQTINFPTISSKNYGDSAFQATATSSSGLALTFSSTTSTSICTVSTLGVVKIITVGDCTVTAEQAGNDTFSAAESVSRTFTINAIVPTPPRIASLFAGDGVVTVSWTAPANNGGSTITGYRVISQSPDDKICETSSADALSCTVGALNNGSSYTFTVTATNVAGRSLSSDSSTAIIPVAKADAVRNATLTAGDQQLTASWELPENLGGGTFVRYELYIKTSGGSYGSAININTEATTSYTFTGLTNGTSYVVKILTITSTVTSSASTEIAGNTAEISQIPAQVPDAPRSVVAVSPDGRSATVTWRVPLSNGGAAIDSYTVTATIGGVAKTCTLASPTATSCVISGISSGALMASPLTKAKSLQRGSNLRATRTSQYSTAGTLSVSVSANNLVGSSSPATATLALPAAPAAPTITQVAIVDGEIVTTYTAPTDDGGSAITGYIVSIYERGSTTVFETCLSSDLSCGAILTGATYAYDYRVAAVNPVGTGAQSVIFSPPVPVVPQSSGTYTQPIPQVPVTPVIGSGGALPKVSPGKNTVNVGGFPMQPDIRILDKVTYSIVNQGMNLSLTSLTSSGEPRAIQEGEVLEAVQREQLKLEGAGFRFGSKVLAWIFSTPKFLGELVVDKDGKFNGAITIPADFPAGEHTIQLLGISSSGELAVYNVGIKVLENTQFVSQVVSDISWQQEDSGIRFKWSGIDVAARVEITGSDGSKLTKDVAKGVFDFLTPDLQPGKKYLVTVTPTGNSAENKARSITVDLPPAAPEQVKVRNLGGGRFEITWTGGKGSSEYVVTTYGVEPLPGISDKNSNESARVITLSVTTKEQSRIFEGVKGYVYQIDVYAIGDSKATSAISRVTGFLLTEMEDSSKDQAAGAKPEETKSNDTKPGNEAGTKPSVTNPMGLSITFKISATNFTKARAAALAPSLIPTKNSRGELTCIGYAYPGLRDQAANRAAEARAKSACKTIKNLYPNLTTKTLVKSWKKASKSTRINWNKSRQVDLLFNATKG